MKNILFPSCIIILSICWQSCKKYEDGPSFTLKTPEARLQGSWVLIGGSWYDGASDSNLENIVWVEEFTEDNDYTLTKGWTNNGTSYNYTIDGTWEWINDKDGIKITEDNGDTTSIVISKLTKTEFTYADTIGDTFELTKLK